MGGSGRSAIVLSGSLAMIGSVLPRWQCNIERISPGRTKGTATVAVQANRSKGTATVAVRYREEAARTSGAAHPEEGSKTSCRQDPARQLTRLAQTYIYSKY